MCVKQNGVRWPFIVLEAAVVLGLSILGVPGAESVINPDIGVTAPEDLMREHGVLRRCLLLYEEGLRRIQQSPEMAPALFAQTAEIIRKFVRNTMSETRRNISFPNLIGRGSWWPWWTFLTNSIRPAVV